MNELLVYSGIADINNFKDKNWKDIFQEMEKYQDEFLSKEDKFRSKEYSWPSDALHNWSRLWEYPYIYSNLQNLYLNKSNDIKLLDIGSGVTFFSFFIASKGFFVTASDIDPIAEKDINSAIKFIDTKPGNLEFKLCTEDNLPFNSESYDVVTSISVIEHVTNFEQNISEIHRVLKQDGHFLLTYDIDLNGVHELKPKTYIQFNEILKKYFEIIVPEKIIHPLNNLSNKNSPYPDSYFGKNLSASFKRLKNGVKNIFGIKYYNPGYLNCQGVILKKKNL